ncbi:hypothetical protein M409DRAFT_22585 [Zasmidium cellare ATCC 36951]|uniref:Uncharacterized protein n=1 Tax=Zasmidium cellare ATCC 36951 TaxID=1080233 RepID=A0A6A6CNV3_ZASCE|nr:uncharacterized protein M409DRAFT_22585 [Zasmidium cellare ATCC 36951]KAF2167156.1 hypothetical protein M409DRAFT_22585 [Zasmidium cellare ATCC 36951]
MSVDELLSRFSSLEMEASAETYHILSLHYLARELLPSDTECYMCGPRNVCQRNRPPADPRLLGMLDYSFNTMISTSTRQEPICGQREHEKLLAAVADLSQFPGESVLKIASYFDDREFLCVVYRFRLQSATVNKFESTREFELNTNEMNALRSHWTEHPWTRLVDHLISRESDRAYYHVQEGVSPWEAYREEEEWLEQPWREQWAVRQIPDVIEAFRSNLFHADTEEKLKAVGVAELHTHCDHSITITRDAMEVLTPESCLAAKCPSCGKAIMTDYVVNEIRVSQESEKAVAFKKENKLWIRLDHRIVDGEFSFDADEIFTALEMSLRSLTPPKMACLPGYSFGDYRATKAVLEGFRDHFEDSDDVFEVTGIELAEHLYRTAMETKIGSSTIPLGQAVRRPRFKEDLEVWLRRAVNLAIASCRRKLEASMDEESMLKAMGGFDLGGGSVESIGAMFMRMGI